MFARLVVPLDGSTFAERALPVAAALADAEGAELAVVRVVGLLAPGEHEPGVVSYLDEHRIAIAQDYVREAAATVRLGRPVSAEAYLAADVAAGILARAADLQADLIVMTSHGESWPVAGALGSVASHVVREANVPVLVIGPRVGGVGALAGATAREAGG
ncbi:MAG: universal stress protein [Dehalococcoidia bacterium]